MEQEFRELVSRGPGRQTPEAGLYRQTLGDYQWSSATSASKGKVPSRMLLGLNDTETLLP